MRRFRPRLVFIAFAVLLAHSSNAQEQISLVDSLIKITETLPYTDPDSTILLATKARDISIALGDSSRIAQSYYRIMLGYYVKGEFEVGFEKYKVAQAITDRLKDSLLIAQGYNALALFHGSQGNLESMFVSYRRALKIYESLGDNEKVVRILYNIGSGHLASNRLDSTRWYFDRVSKMKMLLSKYWQAWYTLNTLRYEVKIKNFNAIRERLPGLKDQLRTSRDKATYEILLGELFLGEKNYKEAERHTNIAIQIFKDSKNKRGLYQSGYGLMIRIMEAKHNYKEVFELKDKLHQGLADIDQSRVVTALDRFEMEQARNTIVLKDNQIEILRQENHLQQLKIRKQNIVLLFIGICGVLVFVSLGLVISRNRVRNANKIMEKNLEIRRAEDKIRNKQLILLDSSKQIAELKLSALKGQMNPHFIFNALSSIQSCIYSKRNNIAIKYLSNFSELLQLVLENSDKSLILLRTELLILKRYTEIESLRFNKQFVFAIDCDRDIDPDDTIVPSLLLQLFVENCIKHAFNYNSESKRIEVKISHSAGQLVYLIIDNGIGINESLKLRSADHNSMGMQIVKEKLKAISDNNDFFFAINDLSDASGTHGTKVIVKFPYVRKTQPNTQSASA